MADIKTDIHDNSIDNSAEPELLGMADEGSFGSEDTHLAPETFLDSGEDDGYHFRDLSGAGVTYRFVQMGSGEEAVSQIETDSSASQFYVIGNPADVFGSHTTKKVIRREQITAKNTTKKRDDKRRATHNEVERRRRNKINTWITKLAALLPTTNHPDAASKGGILAKACDYINELSDKQSRFEKAERDNDKLVMEVLKLNQTMSELRKENSSLKSQLAEKCVIPPMQRHKAQKS